VVLGDRTRQYCDECRPEIQAAQVEDFSAAGRAKLAELRAAGKDPSRGGDAAKKWGAKTSQRKRELAAWEAEHGGAEVDEAVFTNEILPRLQGLSLSALAAATGLSQQYCSLVRRGIRIPHRRHWESLRTLGRNQALP
jgi:hypothetical protein